MANPLVGPRKRVLGANQRCPADIPKKPVIVRSFALCFPIAVPRPSVTGPEGVTGMGLMTGDQPDRFPPFDRRPDAGSSLKDERFATPGPLRKIPQRMRD